MEILNLAELENLSNDNFKILLYGEPLSGKTTFATTFPRPLIVSTDGNIKGLHNVNKDAKAIILSDRMTRKTDSGIVIEESGWETFKKLVDGLITSPDIDTIVIDLLKDVYEFGRAFVLKKLGISHESEDKQRRVWTMIETEIMQVIRTLMTSKKNVILIAHDKERDGMGVVPNIIQSFTSKVISYTDIVARLLIKKNGEQATRMLYSKPAATELAGNRLGRNIELPEPTYEKFIKIIKGE